MVEPTAHPDADRFWRFSLALYLPEENGALFLRLQDEDGMDVPLTLFCLWCGAEGLALSEPALHAAIAFSDDWRRERVEPLRTLRRRWREAPGSLPPALAEAARRRVAAAEQAIERLQMDHLVTLRAGAPDGTQALRRNLDLYARLAGLAPAQVDREAVARIASQQGNE